MRKFFSQNVAEKLIDGSSKEGLDHRLWSLPDVQKRVKQMVCPIQTWQGDKAERIKKRQFQRKGEFGRYSCRGELGHCDQANTKPKHRRKMGEKICDVSASGVTMVRHEVVAYCWANDPGVFQSQFPEGLPECEKHPPLHIADAVSLQIRVRRMNT